MKKTVKFSFWWKKPKWTLSVNHFKRQPDKMVERTQTIRRLQASPCFLWPCIRHNFSFSKANLLMQICGLHLARLFCFDVFLFGNLIAIPWDKKLRWFKWKSLRNTSAFNVKVLSKPVMKALIIAWNAVVFGPQPWKMSLLFFGLLFLFWYFCYFRYLFLFSSEQILIQRL